MEKTIKAAIIFLALMIILSGCSPQGKDFELEHIIKENYPHKLDFYFYYETSPGIGYRTATYIFNGTSVEVAPYTFWRSFAAIYPEERVRSMIGSVYRDTHGQVMIYDRVQGYEFIVTNRQSSDNAFKNIWTIIYIKNEQQREIVIQTNEKGIIPEKHFLYDNTLYLFARIYDAETGATLDRIVMYQVNLCEGTYMYNTYNISSQPLNRLDIVQMIVFNGKIYLVGIHMDAIAATYIQSRNYDNRFPFISYVVSIDINTQEINYIGYSDFLAFRVFEYKGQVIVLKTDMHQENMYIDFLDTSKNIVKTIKVNIPLDKNEGEILINNNAIALIRLLNGDIYFTITSQTRRGRYIVIYNIENEKTSYLGFASHRNNSYRLVYVGFFFNTQN